MSLYWLQTVAAWGLLALAIPTVIHWLVHHQRRRLPFPSLVFLQSSPLVAVRRRSLSDWPLLLVRMLTLVLAVAALGAPVVVSTDRKELWARRVARAIVRAPATAAAASQTVDSIERLIQEERLNAFASAAFAPAVDIGDGIRDAVMWLENQPPAAREVVVVGAVQADSIRGRDIDAVPLSVGIRFLPVPAEPRRTVRLRAIGAQPDSELTLRNLQLTLDDDLTMVHYGPDAPAERVPITVHAAPDDQPRVDAALRAVLAEGLVLPRQERRLAIVFDGAPASVLESAISAASAGSTPAARVLAGMRGSDPPVLDLIARSVRTAFADDLRDLEPRPIAASTLAAWSRPASPALDGNRPSDEGDRRYFWLAVLALLAFEQWARRTRAAGTPEPATREEARVA